MSQERRKGGRRRTDHQPASDDKIKLTNERSKSGAIEHDDYTSSWEGEADLAAAARELREETGLLVKAGCLRRLGVWVHMDPSDCAWACSTMVAIEVAGDPCDAEPGTSHEWIALADVAGDPRMLYPEWFLWMLRMETQRREEQDT